MKKKLLPLHPAQQDVCTDQLINPESPHYNIGGYVRVKGELDVKTFHEVVRTIPTVFDSLGMKFCLEADGPRFFLNKECDSAALEELDFSNAVDPRFAALEWMKNKFNQPFSLQDESPLYEFRLIKISADEHWFYGRLHHLLTDGFGFIVFLQYLAQKYKSLVAGDGLQFNYPSYLEASADASEYFNSPDYKSDAIYWQGKINEKPAEILPVKYANKDASGNGSNTYIVDINPAKRKLLDELQLATKTGLQHITLAALIVYFGKITDHADFVFGIPVHKRSTKKLKSVVGMFSGVLPFKGSYQKNNTVLDLIKQSASAQKIDYRHQHYPIGDLTSVLKGANEKGYLHEISVNYEPLNFELDFGEKIQSEVVRLMSDNGKDPLQISWRDYGKDQPLRLHANFGNEYFTLPEMELFIDRLLYIIEQFASNLHTNLDSINILPEKEKTLLVENFNGPLTDISPNDNIINFFELQVTKNPDSIALEFHDKQFTYQQLDEQANQLANYLKRLGVKDEMLIPICIERSVEMMVGILGILKAGAAYVPIDVAYPPDRILFMLEDIKATLCISSKTCRTKLPAAINLNIISLDEELSLFSNEPTTAPGLSINKNQLAYVIYTSGSTGKPKGVMIEHGTVVNLINAQTAYFNIDNSERILQFSNYCFDASVEQIFLAFFNGARLVLFEEGLQLSMDAFQNYLFEKQVTHVHATPSFLENLTLLDLTYLRRVIAGGDLCKADLANHWKNKIDFFNEYGPTETTVTSIEFKAGDNNIGQLNALPIGKAISNILVYILDKNNALCPVGVAGEICIGGNCLAREYLNRPELTAEKFVANPFTKNSSEKMYRTGDLGRWLTDGNMVYLGRMDEQVKMRGYRIELGEIENVLQNYEGIKQAVVMAPEDKNGNKALVGYVVPKSTFDKEKTQSFLRSKLPEYMIPALWVVLDTIPLTSNGKVNKKLLPAAEVSELINTEFVAPGNEMEVQLAEIWKDILKLDKVGIHDNFFESGGHSLNAIQLTTRLHKLLNIKVEVSSIFSNPTVAQLAGILLLQKKSQFEPIKNLAVKQYYDLSHAQERFWILSHFKDGSEAYNVSSAFSIEGNLQLTAFENAFNSVIERHEILRTVFVEVDGKAQQKILTTKEAGFAVNTIDISDNKDAESYIKKWLEADAKVAFDLSKGPLLKATIFTLAPEKYILAFNIHHIISDGWSKQIFIREFLQYYNLYTIGIGADLQPLPIQYKDYAAWHSASFEAQGKYWNDLYKDDVPVLNFPLDFERPKVLSFFGAMLQESLPKELVTGLKKLAIENNMSLNNLFLALYALIVARYSRQQEVVIGSLSSGRSHFDLENLIGVFINFLPIKFSADKESILKEYLAESNEALSQAYNNQDYPFDLMVEHSLKKRDVSRNPFFDTMLNFHLENDLQGKEDRDNQTSEAAGISIKPTQSLQDELFQSVLDFKLDVEPAADKLDLFLSYNTKLFSKETMQQFLTEFIALLNLVTTNSEKKLADYGTWTDIAQENNESEVVTNLPLNICASFVLDPVQEYIEYWSNEVDLNIAVSMAPYNQVFQQLLNPQSLLHSKTGINVLFIRLDDWLREKNNAGLTEIEYLDNIHNELSLAIEQAGKNTVVPFLVGIVPVLNTVAFSKETIAHISQLNEKLQLLVKKLPAFHLLNLTEIASLYEVEEIFDAISDKLGHMPFTQEYYAAIGTYLARKVNAFVGPNYKVLALDCDNTLWKGVCGELGATGVTIDENFSDLQNFFIQKYHEGFLIVLSSKNNEADVWEVFEKHPGMKLKREHIAAHRINWEPKSDNLLSLSKELNLGINSFIFLDDNEFEIEQMNATAPEVLSIVLPVDAESYKGFLDHIWAFDYFSITAEDAKRNQLYKTEKQRKDEAVKFESVTDFLTSLKIEVHILPLNSDNMERAVQLTLRTNQFNLNGIRKTADDLATVMNEKNTVSWIIEVNDRFGEYGIVGLVMAKEEKDTMVVETFLLSCRVLGRNVEDVILEALQKHCNKRELSYLTMLFEPTPKNKPFQEFLERTAWETGSQSFAFRQSLKKIGQTIS
ncbi:MAG: amino acid adenylation domain-containing protein [Ferruginibacter sp.]